MSIPSGESNLFTRLILPLSLAALLLPACQGQGGTPVALAEELEASAIPEVPTCDDLTGLLPPATHANPISGVEDLYLLSEGDEPLCIGTSESVARMGGVLVADPAASNPMPGRPTVTSSNPMPGSDPAASNPMPGQER